MARKREYGAEQPYIGGRLKLRLPFIHYRFEIPEAAQGFILVAVALSAVAVHMEALGASREVAVLMVIINGLLYMLHPSFGDPVFPGWITPGIPLVLAWLAGFEPGPDRIQAVIALQMLLAVLFLFMGTTGLAKKIVGFVPLSLRCGIILGAGIAAAFRVIQPGPRSDMYNTPYSVIIGGIVTFLILYSVRYAAAKKNLSVLMFIGKYGMLPGMLVALVVGTLIGELPRPQIEWGFSPLPFGELIAGYTIFGIGFPPIGHFISALPYVVAAYLIAFGDFVVADTVLKETDAARQDEKIEFNANRCYTICGIRNTILSLIAPYAPLNGPLWTGGTVAVAERYKQGRESMDSIYGGMGSYVLAMAIAGLLLPIVSLLGPVLPVAMSITMLVTAWACGYAAINMCKTREEQGIAFIMAIALAFQGARIGLAVGIVLFLVIGAPKAPPAAPAAVAAPAPAPAIAAADEKKES